MTESENETYTGPERRTRDRSLGFQLRRRRHEAVENDRRKDLRDSISPVCSRCTWTSVKPGARC